MAEVVEWLRSQIIADKEAAEAASKGEWVSDDGGSIHVGHPTNVVVDWILNDEDLDHVLRQQPRDTIARCEADLAILDEHEIHDSGFGQSCTVCFEEGRDGADVPVEAPCRTVRLLAYGRRYRPGWNPDWTPEGMRT